MRLDRLLVSAALAVSLSLGGVAVVAQPAPPGAAAPPAGAALPPGHPPTGAPAGAPAAMPPGHPPAGAMPPGHPPTGAMPPGHPPGSGASPGMPPGHPGAASPGMGRGEPGMYQPPEDDILDVPEWAPGTVEVEIRDADDKPVAGAPVILGVLHSTVATGEQRERLNATTDERGIARWEGLKFGMAHTYEVSSVRGTSRFEVEGFNLLEKGGRRVVLHVYDTVTDLEEASIGMRVLAFFALREDAIQTEQVIEVFNLGRVAWQAENVKITLPPGFKAFTRSEEGGVANVDPAEDGYTLRGTFRPGRTAVGFRWQMPLENDAEQTVTMGLPPRVAQTRVIAEASKTMDLAVEGAPTPRRTKNRDGRSVLVTERAATQGERGLTTLSITLKGLPTKSPARWIALLAGFAMVAAAGFTIVQNRKRVGLAEDSRDDLIEAREALLAEIVALERAHRRGEVGPKTYERLRGAMLDALANVVGELDRAGIASPTSAEASSADDEQVEVAKDEAPREADVAAPAPKKRKKRARAAGGPAEKQP